jgi:hypothetical protein
MEPLIRAFIEELCQRFEQFRVTGEPVNTLHAYAALTTDIITSYCFGTSYGCTKDPHWKWEWPQAMVESTQAVHINKQFKWLFPMMQATPEWLVKKINPSVMQIIDFQKVSQSAPVTCLTLMALGPFESDWCYYEWFYRQRRQAQYLPRAYQRRLTR